MSINTQNYKDFWKRLHYDLAVEWGDEYGKFSNTDEYGNVECYNDDEYYSWLLEQKERILEEITNFEEFENITESESDNLFNRFIEVQYREVG